MSITDDKRLLVMCSRLREEHGFPVVAIATRRLPRRAAAFKGGDDSQPEREARVAYLGGYCIRHDLGLLYVVGYYLREVGN